MGFVKDLLVNITIYKRPGVLGGDVHFGNIVV